MSKYFDAEQNQKSREDFIHAWVEYMKTHTDKEWSSQQAVLINSMVQQMHSTTK